VVFAPKVRAPLGRHGALSTPPEPSVISELFEESALPTFLSSTQDRAAPSKPATRCVRCAANFFNIIGPELSEDTLGSELADEHVPQSEAIRPAVSSR